MYLSNGLDLDMVMLKCFPCISDKLVTHGRLFTKLKCMIQLLSYTILAFTPVNALVHTGALSVTYTSYVLSLLMCDHDNQMHKVLLMLRHSMEWSCSLIWSNNTSRLGKSISALSTVLALNTSLALGCKCDRKQSFHSRIHVLPHDNMMYINDWCSTFFIMSSLSFTACLISGNS